MASREEAGGRRRPRQPKPHPAAAAAAGAGAAHSSIFSMKCSTDFSSSTYSLRSQSSSTRSSRASDTKPIAMTSARHTRSSNST